MLSPHKNTFLKDLEGLRAIAVLAVLAFHINENILPGGFLGVDLFFVISGYVVTKVLISGGIKGHLVDFYIGRFHRLIPASAVTILFTIFSFYIFANPLVDASFFTSALSATFSLSNIHFLTTSGYWSDELSINPFLHFWSLSAEEQFYFLWPAILFVIAFKKPINTTFSLITLCILGVVLLYAIDYSIPYASFYTMPARIFQFSAGALAFYLSSINFHSYVRPFFFLVGTTTFASLLILIKGEESTLFWKMIVPTFAAFFILCGLQSKISLFLLSNNLFRFIGRISYSLYLVHWPIIILLKLNFGNLFEVQFSAIILSFFCGFLLHEKVEKKYRLHLIRSKNCGVIWPKMKSIANVSIFGASIITITLGLIFSPTIKTFSKEDRYINSVINNTSINKEVKNTPSKKVKSKSIWSCQTYEVGRLNGDSKYMLVDDLDMEQCLEGKVLLLGDSWGPAAAKVLFHAYGINNVATLNSAGCLPIPNFKSDKRPDCVKINEKRFDLDLLSKYQFIFLSTNWNSWSETRVIQLLEYLKNSNEIVYLFSMRPIFSVPVPSLISNKSQQDAPFIDISKYEDTSPKINNAMLNSITSKYENIKVIDWYSPLTKDRTLIAFTPDGKEIYRDKTHLTKSGMEFLSEELTEVLPILKNI